MKIPESELDEYLNILKAEVQKCILKRDRSRTRDSWTEWDGALKCAKRMLKEYRKIKGI